MMADRAEGNPIYYTNHQGPGLWVSCILFWNGVAQFHPKEMQSYWDPWHFRYRP